MKKKFLANIACPNCQEMDRVYYYVENDVQHTRCVHCGDHQQMPPADPSANTVDATKAPSQPTTSEVTWYPSKYTQDKNK